MSAANTLPPRSPEPEQAEPQPGYYRPDEGNRLALAKRWVEQARGKMPEPGK